MGVEIERKFLVCDNTWRGQGSATRIRQGYLGRNAERTVRLRIRDDRAWLTIKGPPTGLVRPEFEYEIPVADAEQMLDLCEAPVITKVRHCIEFAGRVWEVDEFEGALAGLVLAECELESADQKIDLPAWVGEEVSGDPRYYNSRLRRWPFE